MCALSSKPIRSTQPRPRPRLRNQGTYLGSPHLRFLHPGVFYRGAHACTEILSCGDTTNIGNVLDFNYNFSVGTADNGNVTAITNNRDTTRSQNFTYDVLNRIATAVTASTYATSPAHCWGEAFSYDAWGNLQVIGGASSAYTGCTQESLSVSATTKNQLSGYGYDAAGNMTSIPSVASYTYNAENQLVSTAGVSYA